MKRSRENEHRRTRNRVPVSCSACRIRKLKCNREQPCQNCLVRGDDVAESCTYLERPGKKDSKPKSGNHEETMRKRLNRLEDSIMSMMAANKTSAAASPSSSMVSEDRPKDTLDQAGGQRISSDTRSTHWDAILNEVGAIRDAWSEENDGTDFSSGFEQLPPATQHRPGLLSGLTQPPDRSIILSSLPSREAADKLILRFFDSYNPAIPARYVLHRPTFLKQYEQHWETPSTTQIIWIGLLYSMLCIAMQSYTRTHEVPPEYEGTALAITELYRVRTAQCLMIADLTKPGDFMIETLNLHTFAEYTDARDGDMGTWILSGTMMRLALQQGYHRDPSQHPKISVFQGEMRRRIWSAVSQHELLFSVQIGLPKAIRYAECDTLRPRNIYEHELYEGMTELPPERPLTEDTEVSYQIAKYHIMRAHGMVIEFVHLLAPQPYIRVLELDRTLQEAHALIPPHLQLGTLPEMNTDVPSRVMEKYILQIFYHKAVCILHRKHWSTTAMKSYSRSTSVSSALAMLGHQSTMHQASKTGGCLGNLKWWHFAVTNHDFLLAAIILSLDLTNTDTTSAQQTAASLVDLASRTTKLNAFKLSLDIWREVAEECRDAKRAVRILTSVLAKIASPAHESVGKIPLPTDYLDLLQQTSNIPNQTEVDHQLGEESFPALLDAGFFLPPEFDWKAWDQFLAGQSQSQALQADLYIDPHVDSTYLGDAPAVSCPTWLS